MNTPAPKFGHIYHFRDLEPETVEKLIECDPLYADKAPFDPLLSTYPFSQYPDTPGLKPETADWASRLHAAVSALFPNTPEAEKIFTGLFPKQFQTLGTSILPTPNRKFQYLLFPGGKEVAVFTGYDANLVTYRLPFLSSGPSYYSNNGHERTIHDCRKYLFGYAKFLRKHLDDVFPGAFQWEISDREREEDRRIAVERRLDTLLRFLVKHSNGRRPEQTAPEYREAEAELLRLLQQDGATVMLGGKPLAKLASEFIGVNSYYIPSDAITEQLRAMNAQSV